MHAQIFAFEGLARFSLGGAHDGGRAAADFAGVAQNVGGEHVEVDPADAIARCHDDRAFDDVAKLTDVFGRWTFPGPFRRDPAKREISLSH